MIVTNFEAAGLMINCTIVVETVAVEVDVHQRHVLRKDLADLFDHRDFL